MSEMFGDVEDVLSRLQNVFTEILSFNIDKAIPESSDAIASTAMHSVLIKQAEQAVNEVEEYSYPLLRNHFMNHVRDNPQYTTIVDGALVMPLEDAFNKYAGTFDELMDSVQQAGGHTGTKLAPFIWRYGIYMPAREGGSGREAGKIAKIIEKSDIPNYREIIEARISVWGEKAPYWMLMAYGNAGYDRAYPTFSGYNFILATENEVPKIVQAARDTYANGPGGLLDSLNIEVEDFIKTPTKGTRVTVQKYSIAGLSFSRQLTSKGNVFWNFGGHMISGERMVQIIRGRIQ